MIYTVKTVEKKALSIVIPAYGEAENLAELLPRLEKTTSELGIEAEIVIVDAMTKRDNTDDVCGRFASVRHIRRQGDDSYGSAIRSGISASIGEHVIIQDADGSHSPEFIKTLWDQRDEADFIIASRYTAGGQTDNPWWLVTCSHMLNVFYAAILDLRVRDISNSFRIYRGEVLRKLELSCSHFDIQEEILVQLLWKFEQTAKEVPYHFKERTHGSSKRLLVVFIMHFFKSLVRFWFLKRKFINERK